MRSRYRGNRKAMQNWMLSERHKHSGAHAANVLCVDGYLYVYCERHASLRIAFWPHAAVFHVPPCAQCNVANVICTWVFICV